MDASHGSEHAVVATLIALLAAAILVGVVARRFRFPYTVALVVVGVALHELGVVPEVRLTQELLMTALLPALLFEAAIHIPGKELRRFAPSVLTLAVPGVLLATFVTAALLEVELIAVGVDSGIPFLELLLFGAMIAATDPISVVALFKQLGVRRPLAILVEGESLFNDGTAVVVFAILLDMVRTGSFSSSQAITRFFLVAAGGIVIGAAIGLVASWATSKFDDHLIEIALTVVTAYGSFLIAEQIHVSGVLATVVAGLLVGNVGKKTGMSPYTRVSVLSFWEFAAFFVNTLVFLLIGLETNLHLVIDRIDLVLLAFVTVLAARAITVFGPLPFLKRLDQPVNAKVGAVLWWGGLRGGLSLVLALALPPSVTAREEIIAMTFGVVILSVVLQGGTMGLLLRKLGLTQARTAAERFLGTRLARLKAIRQQQKALSEIVDQADLDLVGLEKLSSRLDEERRKIVDELDGRRADPEFIEAATAHAAVVNEHLCEVGRDVYRRAHDDNLIDAREAARLFAGVDDGDPSRGLPPPVNATGAAASASASASPAAAEDPAGEG